MQFSEHWLRQYVDPALDSQGLSHALTMAGLEVEALEPVAPAFSKVVVAEIISAEKHPDADRLQVCKVDVGAVEPLQIVCGAPNARAGLRAPCALVGAELPGFKIKQAKVRGVASSGMMCSAKELGLAEGSDGLLELGADAHVGQDIRELFDLDDQLFTLKLTPNRADCLSITGIARDVAALTGAPLELPMVDPVPVEHARQLAVSVSEPAACPRYAGRLIEGVDAAAATPEWMVRRLERSGIRSISAIVDITNYVLLEQGQPLHAFDADKLQGGIQVRYARSGEDLLLLNGQQVTLSDDMLVIADDQGPLALAGIMGGEASAVGDTTRNIFLESAFFAPAVIVGKARRLNFSTDSSYRFERGVDFGNTLIALERASQLVLEICGGQAGPVTEVLHPLPERQPVRLRLARLNSVLGIALDATVIGALLERLNFKFAAMDGGFEVTPPSYRFDIEIEEDLIEEVARLHGYDHIPALAPHDEQHMLPVPESKRHRNWLRDTLAASGYQEIVSYSFVDESWERDFLGNANPIGLKNPIASNLSVMRTSLWAGLMESLIYNLNRKQERVRLFEIGSAYFAEDSAYREIGRISGLAYGSAKPEQWASEAREVDFFDVKAEVDRLAGGRVQYVAAQHPALHPGQTAQILLQGQPIGWIGKLHPKWQQHYQLPRGAVLFELDVEPLLHAQVPSYVQVGKFPPVRRDIAVLVDEATPIQSLLDTMRSSKNALINDIALFDVYQGKGVPEGKKSLAFLVLMQDTQKTLTDAEADAVMAELLDLLVQRHGAALRN
ncbi:phenylalanine--tRNA ligase subunit beta [Methylobacillus flagellatus]|uniref:Phenylalanine--tRNA ligase beta subunit n=1 Tax=Methylobacillus flagellatus (strain ATCC 51484 / DSM 6875 / VKM B-1610 / KT) TaxID=265072 RepID=Q1GZS2_METFK|nr:phenylalanine--tRNA ligase subunit beta [Methylobacillus flagellatus]ABE50265.1 phenylalanyl-tRNA synthetase beta subunit [Methylobacillus flagellatus KT]